MKMNSNLCKAPWIPVMMSDGSSDLLSLEEAFAQAERIRDLALSPKERISLMRLLSASPSEPSKGRKTCRSGKTSA